MRADRACIRAQYDPLPAGGGFRPMAEHAHGKVLLTDARAKSSLAATRALAAHGLEVHVACDTRLALAFWSRMACRRHMLPSSRTDPRGFARELAALHVRERFDAVIPVSDYDIAALLSNRDVWVGSRLPMALPERAAFEEARDKSRMMRIAMRAGVPCPGTWFPDEEPLTSIRDRALYPLVIKPNISDGARGITLVEGPEHLVSEYERISAAYGPCHLQEWIPEGGSQIKADVIVGRGAQLLALFVCRKIRYFPVKGGSSTLIVSMRDERIEADITRLAAAMDWYGFADFDLIVDPRDGVAKLMECNPRFPESLAVNIFAGADFPWAMFQLARSGHADPIREYRADRFARFLVGDIMWFLHSPERWSAKPSFFRFLGRNMTYYVERLVDPGPIVCYLLETVLTIMSPKRWRYRFARGVR
jgi:D-aspartate ligase